MSTTAPIRPITATATVSLPVEAAFLVSSIPNRTAPARSRSCSSRTDPSRPGSRSSTDSSNGSTAVKPSTTPSAAAVAGPLLESYAKTVANAG
jgi:hypothetical protein